ncbi:MAG: hypothetical protein JSR67_14410 [Proteobacteria bacterium]|nr:hypothetical protein [Pseudomonadota bacterium]
MKAKKPAATATQRGGFTSVSIVHAGKCCATAKSLAGQRFLARNAPALPLPGCTLAQACHCRFQKHQDRRDDYRRLPTAATRWYPGAERREIKGRRKSD